MHSLLLCFLMAVVAQERVAMPPEGPFSPAVMKGVDALAQKQIELIRIRERMANDEAYRPEGMSKLLTGALEVLPPEVIRTISPLPPSMNDNAQEMILHHAGLSIVRASCATKDKQTPLSPDDLFAVITSSGLMDPPGPAYHDVQKFFDDVHAHFPSAALRIWYPNVAYMMFGALHTPAFWPDGEEGQKARETFIMRLLEFTSITTTLEHVAECVEIVLRPPLDVDGKTLTWCAPGLDQFRGKVGFSLEHLAFVESFNKDADSARQQGEPEELAAFFAMIKTRILQELDPKQLEEAHILSAKFGTFDERKAYYNALAARGWQAFWNEAHVDVEKMLSGDFPHSLDNKIALLQEQLAASPGNGELADKIAELESQRLQEQNEIVEHIARIFARDGDPAVVRSELIRMSSQLNGRHVFDAPWMMIVQRDRTWACDALERHLDQLDPLPRAAVAAAIAWMGDDSSENEKIVLMKIAMDGSALERASAMAAAKLSADEADAVSQKAISDLEVLARTGGDVSGRTVLLSGVIRMLYTHRSEDWVAGALLKTFDSGGISLWPGDVRMSAEKNDPVLAWIAGALTAEQKASLARRNLLPPSLLSTNKQAASGS